MTNTPPASTYRLQLRNGMDLDGAAEIVSYLHDLGIEWLYASPIAQAAEGSPHGYDVVDPNVVDPALGGEEALERLGEALDEAKMGLLLDVVPNHMRATMDNPWWRDQLEHGPASSHVECFDIRWTLDPQARLVLPVLGRHYGEAIEDGELKIAADAKGLVVRYHDHAFPLDPRTWASVLDRLGTPTAQALAAACRELPPRIDTPAAREHRAQATPELRRQLRQLLAETPELRETITRQWSPGHERFRSDDLHALLEAQAYRLAYWQSGLDDLNYRRFFDINELVALRMERPSVFDAHHRQVLELVGRGRVTGLRIDHVDGLADPRGYLERLRGAGVHYLVVEKILLDGEDLPGDWNVDGTTGYEYIAAVGPLLVDPEGFAKLDADFRRATGSEGFEAEARQGKLQVLGESLAPALRSLASDLHQLTLEDLRARDVSVQEIEQALAALTAGLPVYRTYSRGHGLSDVDRAHLEVATARAREQLEPRLHCALEFIGRVLANELEAGPTATSRARAFVRRWQQLTGPATAKGVEDTALYRYVPNLCLADVGCEPVLRDKDPSAEFTAWAVRRRERMPRGMLALATHDTKRGQDVRARLYALTERADAYIRCRDACARGLGVPTDDPAQHEELEVLLQTVIGSWPLIAEERETFPERLRGALCKSAREAKRRTSWVRPEPAVETAIVERATDLLEALDTTDWGRQLSALQREIEFLGAINGLSQLVLQLASPGVCDVYQGCEGWDLSLVDPDNRRPVGFTARRHRLNALLRRFEEDPEALLPDLRESWRNGRIKTHVLTQGLRHRRDRPGPFLEGEVVPVDACPGAPEQHLQVLARRLGGAWVVAVVARRVGKLVEGVDRWPIGDRWAGATVRLPAEAPGSWRDVLTGRELRAEGGTLQVPAIFAELPVALLCAGA